MSFLGKSPFSFSALDIKTLAAAALGCDYTKATKRNWPKHWFSKRPHTHIALDDAIAQGEEFFNIKRDLAATHEDARLYNK
jgi:CBS-domain-containing membrane protein